MLRALIVDDEQPARERLAGMLRELGQVEIVGEARNAAEALQLFEEQSPDVLYLDIRMPGVSGLELARHLNTLPEPPAVIFTTAYDQHAMAAFDAAAIAYLLKPIRREKLAAATERAGRLTSHQADAVAAAAPRTHLAVRHRDGIRLLRIEEIICLLADQKYTTVRHAGGDDLVEDSLRTLESEFGDRFLRVHRGALVNREHIEAVERSADGQYSVRLRGIAEPLSVSRRHASDLKAKL